MKADAAYYENQLKAYAVALHQQGTSRAVRVSLVFTAADDAWEVTWSPENLLAIRDGIEAEIADRPEELPTS